jgi:hypothetical protein
MSFSRLIYYSAMIAGWAAFVGWLLSELLMLHRSEFPADTLMVLTFAMVGAAIAGGLNVLAVMASGQLRGNVPKLAIGVAGGFVGGALGGSVSLVLNVQSQGALAVVLRAIGWAITGLCIGSVEGIADRSVKKIRNGLIGGGLGGFVGGLLFLPVLWIFHGIMASRATSFVILGTFIGLFIGLAQVILKEAWLTVVEGFRPGRQLILYLPETVMGTSEKSQLPFIAYGAKGVEPIHVRILHRPETGYILVDNHTRTGTMVNGHRVTGPVLLRGGDLIQFGPNAVRYSERFRRVEEGEAAMAQPRLAPAGGPVEAIPVNMSTPPPQVPAMGRLVNEGVRRESPPAVPKTPAQQPHRPPGPPAPGHYKPAPPSAPPVLPTTPHNPAPPAPSGSAPVPANACPICGRPGQGNPGKRLCDNCGIRF